MEEKIEDGHLRILQELFSVCEARMCNAFVSKFLCFYSSLCALLSLFLLPFAGDRYKNYFKTK